MASGNDKKLHDFKCELASLIGKHVVSLDEASISEVLEEYSETLQRKSPSRPRQTLPPRETLPPTLKPSRPEPALTGWSAFVEVKPRRHQPDKSWDLERHDIIEVFKEVIPLQSTGLLAFHAGQQGAEIVVSNGEIHDLRILPASDRRSLVTMLHEQGRISAEHLARVKRFVLEQNAPEAKALMHISGALTKEELVTAVRARIRHLTARLLGTRPERATYHRLDATSTTSAFGTVPAVGLLFTHLRAKYGEVAGPELKQLEQRMSGMLLFRAPGASFEIARQHLRPHERTLLDQALEKPRNFETVLRKSLLPRNETIAILIALEAMGLLETTAGGLSSESSSSWAEEISDAVERLEAMETKLDQDNPFDILGLHWATHDGEIDRRYRQLKEQFDTLSQPLGMEAEHRRRIRRIRERLSQVHAELGDAKRRQVHRRKLVSSAEQRKVARQFEALAQAAMQRNAFDAALDYYQRVLELDPNNLEAGRMLPNLLMRVTQS
jgi:hypothetical protein